MWGKSRKILIAIATTLFVAMLAVAFAYSFPADLALLAAIDMSVYVDVLVGVYLVANIVKFRLMLQLWKQRLARLLGRSARHPVTRVIKDSPDAGNDGDPAHGALLAA